LEKQTNKKRIRVYIISALVIVAAVLVLIFGVFGSASADETEESIQAIKNTIMEKSLQCYVIEGAYPDDLSYLEEHYGLIINQKDYYIVYTPVAENIPPEVVVVYKQDTGKKQ